MILEVFERLALMELLPKEGDFAALKTIRRSRETIAFTAEEQKALAFENAPNGTLVWDLEIAAEMQPDLPVDEWTSNKIREILINQSNEGKLKDQVFTLYEKFVIAYE